MSKGRILVVEDDLDISKMLRIYFDSQGYEVLSALRGEEALEISRKKMPNIVVLDIQLPDIDGYEVCRQLRNSLRTSHIPIIFLTQKDERSDKIAGLELGADDYITKPFDIEELKLRVQGAMRRATYESLTDPTTSLPSSRLIEEQLRSIISRDDWVLLYIGINNIDAFTETQGMLARDDVLRFTATMLNESVEKYGTVEDFIGHAGGIDFIVTTAPEASEAIIEEVTSRFNEEVKTFYDFRSREAGEVVYTGPDGKELRAPLMTISVGLVSPDDGPFYDIRYITEVAAEARRKAMSDNGK